MFTKQYLEDIVANVVNLNNWRVAFAEFRVEHAIEARRRRDQDDLVRVEDASFHSELDVTQFGIVNEFRIDSRSAVKGRVTDLFDGFATVTSGEDVGQQQGRSLVLKWNEISRVISWRVVELPALIERYLAVAENVED